MARPKKASALADFCSKKGLSGVGGKESRTLSVRFVGANLTIIEELERRFPGASPSDLIRTAVQLLHKESGAGN